MPGSGKETQRSKDIVSQYPARTRVSESQQRDRTVTDRVAMPKLELIDGKYSVLETIARHIRRHARKRGSLEILEAGCGRRWPFDLSDVDFRLTGIDLDRDALKSRLELKGDIDVAIHGDLGSARLAEEGYDVIYSSYVLEHVPDGRLVLDNFVRWVRPGGMIILRFPNRDSVYGSLTRITPFWMHVKYKRYLRGRKNAGKPGHGPYPTYHDEVISRKAFHQYVAGKGLRIEKEYGYGRLPFFLELLTASISSLSLGTLRADHINLMYVLRKTES